MKCSWECIDLGWRLGAIGEMVQEAIEIAKLLNTQCVFEFNGVGVCVDSSSTVDGTSNKVLQAVLNNELYVSGIH